MKNAIIVGVIVLAVVVGIVLWQWSAGTGQTSVTPLSKIFGGKVSKPIEPESGLGAQLFGDVQQNPVEKIPDTSPIQNDLNPYKGVYTNPF